MLSAYTREVIRVHLLICTLLAVAITSACTATPEQEVQTPKKDPIQISANVQDGAADVPVDTVVTVDGLDGSLTEVTLATADGKQKIDGTITGVRWTASDLLTSGASYVLTARGTGDDGVDATSVTKFSARKLTLDEQTYPSVAPLKGETVGVGMPVIVTFDLPVKDRAAFEKRMHVTAEPATEGGWYWLSDSVAHWRPKTYWAAGTKVHVDLDVESVAAGGGIYGQLDQVVDFTVGRSVVSTVNVDTHQMKVAINGKVVRTIPVSTGDSEHQTRRGIKVIMEKFDSVDMDAATTGVDSDDPGYYNLKGVKWAMRLTNSGEFVHAAPWSVNAQGSANVSHGCTGMSTANADWLYHQSKRGDVVRFVGSDRRLEPQNGWTDWNVSWQEWLTGSALSTEGSAA